MHGTGPPPHAGLFHGIVNRQDGVHARFNRAAALQAGEAARFAIARHGVAGEVNGLLRLETSFGEATAMEALLEQLALPAGYVRALSASEASVIAGTPLPTPAWFYPGGGWIDPAGLAAAYLARAGDAAQFQGHRAVHAITHDGTRWTARDAHGYAVASAASLVLANAGDALRLLHQPPWPWGAIRGQLSLLPADSVARHGLRLPAVPVAGAGYLLRAGDGSALFGATADREDADPAVRDTDHARTLLQATRLLDGLRHVATQELRGRTGWRWVTDDRLPIVGAVPDEAAAAMTKNRLHHARQVPRVPGLFVFTALGSRGITWSALGARVLAAAVTGAPMPLEASLVEAIDPARFIARASRRAAADAATASKI
jgi:tRNA 5-methylaminomethyl-2-thiouridine biosynthesis bifunctional protein